MAGPHITPANLGKEKYRQKLITGKRSSGQQVEYWCQRK